MEVVAVDDIDPSLFADGTACQALSDSLDATHLAINRYRVSPGGGFPGGLHAHMDQEEVFVVLDGSATFETMTGEVTVDAGEAVRFEPGEFQSGWNRSDEELVALALGAPRETEDIRIPVACLDCGHEDVRLVTDADTVTFVCPACGTEAVTSECPGCGHDGLRVTLDDTARPLVVCHRCEAGFEDPPLRE